MRLLPQLKTLVNEMNLFRHAGGAPELIPMAGATLGSVGLGGALFIWKTYKDPEVEFTENASEERMKRIRPNESIKLYTVNKQFLFEQPKFQEHDLAHVLAKAERSV